MKILCCCNEGNNRSVHFAHLLKYWKNDTISIGLDNTTEETLEMLYNWADMIICTDITQEIPKKYKKKYKLLDVGKDIYPRPFNKQLNLLVRNILEKNKEEFI